MRNEAKIESSGYFDLGRVIKWFINLRWIASFGIVGALFAGQFIIGFELSYTILYIIAGSLLAANSVFHIVGRRRAYEVSRRNRIALQLHLQISFDFILLFLLIYFTGFLQNPLIYYFVFHLMLASFIFPKRTVYGYLTVLVAAIVAVSFAEYIRLIPHYALSLNDLEGYYANQLFLCFALVSTIVIATYLIISIKERIEERGAGVELELDRYKGLERAKSQFILQVTHELRGPIAAIKGYHEMMLKGITGELPEKTLETLSRATRRTTNLLMIIDEMLDFAYMKSEDDTQKKSAIVDLNDVVRNNLELIAPLARQKQVRLESAVPKGLSVNTNRDLINIILGNLLSNAVKYSTNRGEVLVGAEDNSTEIHIYVSDEGMGIESGELERIFEEFYRTRRARKVENDGTGLGLAIVQKAVTVLGGRLSVYSELGEGTRMHVFLPVYQAELTNEGA